MRAKYTPETAQITLNRQEVITVMKALDVLRYSDEASRLTGSWLLDIAALSSAWMCMTQDMNAVNAAARCEEHNHNEIRKEIAERIPNRLSEEEKEALRVYFEEGETHANVH